MMTEICEVNNWNRKRQRCIRAIFMLLKLNKFKLEYYNLMMLNIIPMATTKKTGIDRHKRKWEENLNVS